jgi:hypothetical protein
MVALMAVQTFYNVWVTIYWLANRAYIATTLCENRSKPQLHCDGKCYLAKKLAQSSKDPASTQDSKFPDLKTGLDTAEFVFTDYLSEVNSLLSNQAAATPAGQKDGRDVSLSDTFFHPPA